MTNPFFFLLVFTLYNSISFGQGKKVHHKEYFSNGELKYEWFTVDEKIVNYWNTYSLHTTKYYQRNYNTYGQLKEEGWKLQQQKDGFWTEYKTPISAGKGFYKKGSKVKTWKYHTYQTLDSTVTFLSKKKQHVKTYYANGQKKAEGHRLNNLKNGYWHFYNLDGKPLKRGEFINNKKNKWWAFFSKSGQLSHKCELKENVVDGYCIYYKKNKIVKGKYFKKGVQTKEWTDWNTFKRDYVKFNE